jgi:hypothetical protein
MVRWAVLFISVFVLALSVTGDRATPLANETLSHGGGLNSCGCHFNRKTGECHCHRPHGCGCSCQPATCK